MPFSLKNAPATFQYMVDNILCNLCFTCAIAYIDNILIHLPDVESHKAYLVAVVERLQNTSLYCKLSKCKFFKTQVSFLGNLVLTEGLANCPDKRKAILEYPTLTSSSHVCSFVGTTTYLNKFSPAVFELLIPPYHLVGKNAKFIWGTEHQQAFEAIKDLFVSPVILKHTDTSKPFIVACNTSKVAMGAVLLQEHHRKEYPVAYYSRNTQTLKETGLYMTRSCKL